MLAEPAFYWLILLSSCFDIFQLYLKCSQCTVASTMAWWSISYSLDDPPQRLWGYLHTKSSPYGEISVLYFTQYETEEVRHGILGVLRKWDFFLAEIMLKICCTERTRLWPTPLQLGTLTRTFTSSYTMVLSCRSGIQPRFLKQIKKTLAHLVCVCK